MNFQISINFQINIFKMCSQCFWCNKIQRIMKPYNIKYDTMYFLLCLQVTGFLFQDVNKKSITYPRARPTTSFFCSHNWPGAYNPLSSTELLSPLVRNFTLPFFLENWLKIVKNQWDFVIGQLHEQSTNRKSTNLLQIFFS